MLHVGPQQTPYNYTKKGLQAACRRLASLSHRPGGIAVWAPMPNASERIHVHVFSVRFTAPCHSFVHTLSHRRERMTASENDVGTTQLVTSDIARWGKQGREVGSSKTQPHAAHAHAIQTTRPSVAYLHLQSTWQASLVHGRLYVYMTRAHDPVPHTFVLFFHLSSAVHKSPPRFFQIGELKWFPRTNDRGPAASCS
ncbi:hypothetical protein CCHR01_15269 [Colletotrichum chrysophilum]|uniref:Uncharacterized protein n=1 Tax=Colletotrichum chrysophilum TaxID=1836956 RepID=A0AAD9A8K5_9PEZI|nr:hypothetical protein CCHR01_15269 [Colletotrichum chrysophilum]